MLLKYLNRRVILSMLTFGATYKLMDKAGLIREEPGTHEEKEEMKDRYNLFIAMHWMVWFGLGMISMYWACQTLGVEWTVAFPVFIFVGSLAPAALTAAIMNKMFEQNPKHRIVKSSGPPRGFWKELWEEGSLPQDKADKVDAWLAKVDKKVDEWSKKL